MLSVLGLTNHLLTQLKPSLLVFRAMTKTQGKVDQTEPGWHRDAAIVLREPLYVDPEVARLRIARTMELLGPDDARNVSTPESRIVPSSKRESGVLQSAKRHG